MYELNEKYQEMRNEFMSDKTGSMIKAFNMIFKKAEIYEEKINKPLEEFDSKECRTFVFEYLVSKTVNSLSTKVSNLRRYLKYVGNDSANDITRQELKDAIEKYLGSDDSSVKYIGWQDLVKAMEDKLEYYMDKAIICLLHLGIAGAEFKDIRYLKVEDIDFINNRLTVGDKIYHFDNYIKSIFMGAKDEIGYDKIAGDGYPQTVYYNQDNPYLIKSRPLPKTNAGLDPHTGAGMVNRIYKVFKKLGLNITATNVLQSTIADKLYELEKSNNIILTRKDIQIYLKTNGEHYSDYDLYILKEHIKKNNKEVNK